MVNIVGRTITEQQMIDSNPNDLWGKFAFLYQFVFTLEELKKVENAKLILKQFRYKVDNLTKELK